jgi:outer membrane protein assembly factor BamB
VLTLLTGADWLRFRGPNGSGVADEQTPTSWSVAEGENIAWVADLPGRGSSCPIVIGDRVVVTCASGYRQDQLHVVCLDASSGEPLWQRDLWATGRTMTHSSITPAAPTPASDGRQIFASFSTNDVACFDLDGNLRWLRALMLEYPNASNSLGLASSPVVVDDTVVLAIENDSQSLALGLAAADGRTRWVVDRPASSNWTSPVLLEDPRGQPQVLLQSARGLTAYDPLRGMPLWQYDGECQTIPSSVAQSGTAYVPSNGLTALRPVPGGTPAVAWQNSRLGPSTPTPLLYQGRVYVVAGSVLKCADADSGEQLWQLRLGGGRFSASPVAADGHVYLFSQEGRGQVVVADDRGRIVGGGDLDDTILGTPALAAGAIYVRGDSRLWKIAAR